MSRVCKKNDNGNDKLQCLAKKFDFSKYKKYSPSSVWHLGSRFYFKLVNFCLSLNFQKILIVYRSSKFQKMFKEPN